MTPIFKWIGAPRLIPLAILSASVGALGFAYTAEIAFDYEPCQLCLYQRIPFAIAGILALLALAGPMEGIQGGRTQTIVIMLCGVVFLASAGLAVYHVGVEQHWWASAVCGGTPGGSTFEQMQKALMKGEPKACDVVDWQLFGISMAGYNIVYSVLLATGCFTSTKYLQART